MYRIEIHCRIFYMQTIRKNVCVVHKSVTLRDNILKSSGWMMIFVARSLLKMMSNAIMLINKITLSFIDNHNEKQNWMIDF